MSYYKYEESEYEIAWAAIVLYVALLSLGVALCAWWSAAMMTGYAMAALCVLLLLRSAKHVRRAWDAIQREKEEPQGIDLWPRPDVKLNAPEAGHDAGFRKVAGKDG